MGCLTPSQKALGSIPHVHCLWTTRTHSLIPPKFPIWMFIKCTFIFAYSTPYLLVNIMDLNSLSSLWMKASVERGNKQTRKLPSHQRSLSVSNPTRLHVCSAFIAAGAPPFMSGPAAERPCLLHVDHIVLCLSEGQGAYAYYAQTGFGKWSDICGERWGRWTDVPFRCAECHWLAFFISSSRVGADSLNRGPAGGRVEGLSLRPSST